MMKMVDGAENEGLYGQISSNCPDKNTLNQIFMEQNLTDHRLDLVHRVCNQSISEITLLNQMINEHHILPEKQLEFRSLSQDNFYAHASKTCFSDDNYEISFSLGIPAILLSIAIELDTTTTIAEYQDDNQNSINHWLPHIETIESVSKETIDWVLDACLLLYFHEVCHVLLGHCDYTENNHDETKALELHADLNAGILFSIFLNYLENERNDKLGLRALIWCIRAGYLVGIALKALSDRTEKYHLPTSRIMSIYQGYIALHDLSQEVPSFETDINRNNYYSNLVLSIREPIDKALHSSSLNYFVGTESEIDNDYKSLLEETVPLIEELKQNGSLRKVYFSNS